MITLSGSHSGYMVKVTAPLIDPTLFGVNVTPRVQLAPGLNPGDKPQGFVPAETMLKSPLTLNGISEIPDRSMRLVTVTTFVALVVPTVCPGKFRVAGVNCNSGRILVARGMTSGLEL